MVGLVAIIVFYLLILGIGIWAALKKKTKRSETSLNNGRHKADETEDVILAGRSLGLFVGAMTMTG